jgi:iron complex outermembrane receptor protein
MSARNGDASNGDCFYYNPFQTSVFDPVTGARWNTADTSIWAGSPLIDVDGDGDPANDTPTVAQAAQRFQNSPELIQNLAAEIRNQSENEQIVFDAVFAGDLFDINAGTVGLAVGGQYRRDEILSDSDANQNANNLKFVFGAQDYSGSLTTYAAFAEVFVPLTSWADLAVAGRYENFDEINVDTFDPKISFLAQPTDSLSLRASRGTSFRVGSLLQLIGQQTSLLNSTDPFSATGGLAFHPSITLGNEDLQPEDASTFSDPRSD